jgi:hypothetical protein
VPVPETESLSAAYVCHQTNGRARVRIPSRRGDGDFFTRVEKRLQECPAIEELYVNSSTASVLVFHGSKLELGTVFAYAVRHGLFRLAPDGQVRVRQSAREKFVSVDHEIRKLTGNEVDLGGLAFVALAGCALYQLWRGEILAPATTLLWYAAGTLVADAREATREIGRNDGIG